MREIELVLKEICDMGRGFLSPSMPVNPLRFVLRNVGKSKWGKRSARSFAETAHASLPGGSIAGALPLQTRSDPTLIVQRLDFAPQTHAIAARKTRRIGLQEQHL